MSNHNHNYNIVLLVSLIIYLGMDPTAQVLGERRELCDFQDSEGKISFTLFFSANSVHDYILQRIRFNWQ